MHQVEMKVRKTYTCGLFSATGEGYDEWVIKSPFACYTLDLNRGLLLKGDGVLQSKKEFSQILAIAAKICSDRDIR